MVEKRAECFDEIHALLKEDRLDAALDRLLDVDRGRLEPPSMQMKITLGTLIAEIFSIRGVTGMRFVPFSARLKLGRKILTPTLGWRIRTQNNINSRLQETYC